MSHAIRLGIMGDFNTKYHSHPATNAAIQHAARALGLTVESYWLPTPSLVEPGAADVLTSHDGLWAAPVSPYGSMAGMLAGIRFARERDWPLMAT
jgi:CTP synthase (UTP-ammonia lyase)